MTFTEPVLARALRQRVILDHLYALDADDAVDARMVAFRARQAASPPLDYVPAGPPAAAAPPDQADPVRAPLRAVPGGPTRSAPPPFADGRPAPTPLRRRTLVE